MLKESEMGGETLSRLELAVLFKGRPSVVHKGLTQHGNKRKKPPTD
jgi:hypothetical protein